MTDKELAEKIAGHFGYKLVSDCWWEKLEERPNSNKIPDYELEEYIFSWPTFGLIIEKAEEMGWHFYCDAGLCGFQNQIYPTEGIRYTDMHSTEKHRHVKATALAFLEIFDK